MVRLAVVENDVCSVIRLVDVPQLGHSVSKDVGCAALCDYAREQLLNHVSYELDSNRAHRDYDDCRVHVCLYFIPPHLNALSALDLCALREISQYTSVLIVVGKADLMTVDEQQHQAQQILQQCQEHQITLFDHKLHRITTRVHCEYQAELENQLIKSYMPGLIGQTERVHYEKYRQNKQQQHLAKRGVSIPASPVLEAAIVNN